jgi:hypothetical protein
MYIYTSQLFCDISVILIAVNWQRVPPEVLHGAENGTKAWLSCGKRTINNLATPRPICLVYLAMQYSELSYPTNIFCLI